MNQNLGIAALVLVLAGCFSSCTSQEAPAAKPIFSIKSAYGPAIFSPDGKTVATVGDKNCFLWTTDPSDAPKKPLREITECQNVVFSADSKQFLTTYLGERVKLWRNQAEKDNSVDLLPKVPTECENKEKGWDQVSPDFKTFACRSWDNKKDEELHYLYRNGSDFKPQQIAVLRDAESIRFSPDSRYVVALTADENAFQLWKNEPEKEPKPLATIELKRSPYGHVQDFVYMPDGKHLVALSYQYTEGGQRTQKLFLMRIQSTEKPIVMAEIELDPDSYYQIQNGPEDISYHSHSTVLPSPDGTTVAIKLPNNNDAVTLVPMQPDTRLSTPLAFEVKGVVFSPDGKSLAIVSRRNIKLFKNERSEDPRPYATLLNNSFFERVVFSPNSQYLAVSSFDKVKVWNNEPSFRPKPIASFEGERPLSFSPDNKMILIRKIFPHEQGEAWTMPLEGAAK